MSKIDFASVNVGDVLEFEVDYTGLMHLCANRGIARKYRR